MLITFSVNIGNVKMQYIATLWNGFVTPLWNEVFCEALFWSDVMDGDTHTYIRLCDADLQPTILASTH